MALCAVEADPAPGDIYLDDADHYALAAKFSRDWSGQRAGWAYPLEWAAMDTQKVRDAEVEHAAWQDRRDGKAKGGRARAAKLSPERRSEIARQGARARWGGG